MARFQKIPYYDLRLEGLKNRLPNIIGRNDEINRIARIITRNIQNNCLIVGKSGMGKTALIHGLVKKLSKDVNYNKLKFIELKSEGFYNLGVTNPPLQEYQEALNSLPSCVLFIDDFGSLIHNNITLFDNLIYILKPILERSDVQIILTLEPYEYTWIEENYTGWINFFEIIDLKNQPFKEQVDILKLVLTKSKKAVLVPDNILESIVKYTERFAILGQMPKAAIKILDESLGYASMQKLEVLKEEIIQLIISDKTNIPLSQLQTNEKELLKNLEADINKKVIGQGPAIKKITSTIQRAKLGLRNQNRPLGSFLVLGPSGVGKTETAKVLAEKIFGKKESFIRIDMSEFGQEHTVQRLIGAPPGYVGYDSGGGLTNPIKKEPYSLILLDEIEKAHPKVFDIFLQILDDGRLTSGQGETVDFTQTIIMATSNLAVSEIIEGFEHSKNINSESFIKEDIIPVLTKAFRPEFLNRFDSIIIFNPLVLEDLVKIAQLEIKKIEERVKIHKIRFNIKPEVLAKQIEKFIDHRFGARPIRRFIEETCETLITKNLLK